MKYVVQVYVCLSLFSIGARSGIEAYTIPSSVVLLLGAQCHVYVYIIVTFMSTWKINTTSFCVSSMAFSGLHRQTTEALLRYHLYVDCMPVHGVEGMSDQELVRVTHIASSSSHTAKSERYV